MKKEEYSLSRKYVFWGIIIILLILSYLIIQPYLVALISAFIFAFLLRPLHIILSKKINSHLSAWICILLLVLVILIPVSLLIGGAINQGSIFLSNTNLTELKENIANIPIINSLNIDIEAVIVSVTKWFVSQLTSILLYIPNFVISLFIIIMGIYYILINWTLLTRKLENYIPFKNKKKTLEEINQSTKGIIYGTFITGLIQFAIAAIALYLIGVKYYLIWAFVIFFTAIVPGIGPGIVWVPLTAYYLINNQYTKAIAIFVVIFGIIGLYVDNVVRSKIVGSKAKINPFVMLLGLFGGLALFGLFGFIIGPLVLSYAIKLLNQATQK